MAFLTIRNILNPKPWRVVHYLQLLPSGTGVQLSVSHLSDLWLHPRLCGTKQEVRSTGLFLWSTRSGYKNQYLPISRKGTAPLPYNRPPSTIIGWKLVHWLSLNTRWTVRVFSKKIIFFNQKWKSSFTNRVGRNYFYSFVETGCEDCSEKNWFSSILFFFSLSKMLARGNLSE